MRHIRNRERTSAALFLLVLAFFGLAVYTPWLGLVGDDWWFFAHLSDGDFLSVQLYTNPARPVQALIWAGLWQVFRLNLWLYYALNGAAQWLTAFLVFNLLRYLFHWSLANAAITAGFALLFPADTSHAYLDTLSTRICVLWAVAGSAIWLYAHARLNRPTPWVGLGLILMALALLTYETPLFLFALMPMALARIHWRGTRQWLAQAIPCYSLLLGYLIFRLGVVYFIAQRPQPHYVRIDLTLDWLMAQSWEFVAAISWKGWLYALKVMYDFGLWPSAVMFLTGMAILLPILARWRQSEASASPEWWKTIFAGCVLALAGAIPVLVSSASLINATGTLDGRLIHASAVGHAMIITGLSAGVSLRLASRVRTQNTLWAAITSASLSIALIGGLGVQREYARAWQTQLSLLRQLQTLARSFPEDTTILLFDVSTSPYDIRFYYPFTQLVRRFYATPTLHVLPWQKGFPPDKQLLVFGQANVIAMTDIVQSETEQFEYEHIVAFRVQPDGELTTANEIESQYLLRSLPGKLAFPLPANWRPTQMPIKLRDLSTMVASTIPPETEWRQWLLLQIDFAARFKLP